MLTAALLLAFSQTPADHRCLGFISSNLAKGNGNYYEYVTFSRQRITIQKGDSLVYDIWLDPANPEPKGGIDVNFESQLALREHHIADQNGIDSHGDGVLKPAVGQWYTRKISLEELAGAVTTGFDVVFEGDAYGKYTQFVDNVAIEHADGTRAAVFPNGAVPLARLDETEGYSDHFALGTALRSAIKPDTVQTVVQGIVKRGDRYRSLAEAQSGLDLAKALNAAKPDTAVTAEISAADVALKAASEAIDAPDATYQAKFQVAMADVKKTSKFLKGFTASAIGHAHIDVQWLWESQESLQAAHDTWRQALKFMTEFPEFKFTQSSAGYYREVQYTWPEIFADIKKRVKEGRWEIVGGRECEADENLISPEAHARHFLYAQRYFRENFGKTAVVGWEPDTFGHTAQMPQILNLGGCKYFYFCRGGKGAPAFTWKALDGSSVLAFDSASAGNWYNISLNSETLAGLPRYVKKTGIQDTLWSYGVGNHGGGPSREHIETAKAWQSSPSAPTVKFSTAEEFFHRLTAYQPQLPTVQSELQGVFQGCYTTNASEKRNNRQAEAEMVTAEATASVANYLGHFPYPGAQFAKNWEKIAFNQHHDTMCGSSYHWAYLQTNPDLAAVFASAKDIERDALVNLSVQVKPRDGGDNFMVFNPTGWNRSGWVQVRTPGTEEDGHQAEALKHPVAVAPNGEEFPVQLEDPVTHQATFYAKDVPAFGYRVYVIKEGKAEFGPVNVNAKSGVLENDKIKVTFDVQRGCIKSLVDKATGKEYAGAEGLGALEDHMEKPHGMDAWELGEITKVIPIMADGERTAKNPGYGVIQFKYHLPDHTDTPIIQSFRLEPGSNKVEVDFNVDWRVVSNSKQDSPMIRVAFTGAEASPTATYQVPFGAVSRPLDRAEGPAQAWADISGKSGGITVIEDSKHGFSAAGQTLRMTVIRGATGPDMLPNPGPQPMRYTIIPHEGGWANGNGSRAAMELENGLSSIVIPGDANGTHPLEFSFATVADPNVVPTCLKKAEDGDAFVIRMYESLGRTSMGALRLTNPTGEAKWVNFLEDALAPATLRGSVCPLALRPWQIATLRFSVQH